MAASGTEITLRVPHGCDGAATDTLEVKIPAGVTNVKPKLMAGWTIDVVSDAAGPGIDGARTPHSPTSSWTP